ncbi:MULTISPECIES: response regulator [Turicibacter]|uniref:response regulator n=1 Tax=Turicibacter TaxID=191303 RepID=UPI0001FDB2F5|nr:MULTISPECIES: response regulator [Turicibacter]EGC92759.1 response regulator receiver domain protein [Turicibacter sp. HGF1]
MDKVLIVEDDPMVALINKRYLQQFRQIEIFGPVMYEEEVLSYLEAQKIDLIIMDVFLPKKSGLEILKTIREKEYTVDVIMVTAANSSMELKQAFAYGAIDYLVKPFESIRFEEAYKKYQSKKGLLLNQKSMTQKEIDAFMKASLSQQVEELPKGLNKRTLEKITLFLKEHPDRIWTLREIANETKISNVTIKKYMDYLESQDKLYVQATTGNVGRPELKYSIKL